MPGIELYGAISNHCIPG